MKKIVLTLLSLLFLSATAQAHPPTSVEIDYVLDDGQLYVYMEHLSRDHRKHYIRKTSIFLNEKEVATESNRQQIDPNAYAFSVSLEAKEGDLIEVKAFSSEGGVASGTLTVPEKGEGKTAESAVKVKVEEFKNKDRSSGVYDSQEKVIDNKSDVYGK